MVTVLSGCFCPLCENRCSSFLPFGVPPRPNAMCQTCKSLERHRLMWLYFSRKMDFFDGTPRRILHIAPNFKLSENLRAIPGVEYVSGDMNPSKNMIQIDITAIPYPDEYFDVIVCSHVLEHIPDDLEAMAELCRVLKPTGWGVLLVPIRGDNTIEDPTITSPEERHRLFGRSHHVRWYGERDFVERLRRAGFIVTIEKLTKTFSAKELAYYRLSSSEHIYLCRK